MITDQVGRQLHDRATRGEALSSDEQLQLDEWYGEQDRIEAALLASSPSDNSVNGLQSQIDTTLVQLTAVTRRIQEIAAENEALRHEITLLRRQVPQFA